MSLKRKSYSVNLLQLIILTIISIVIIFINDTYFKTNFIKYFDTQRLKENNINHVVFFNYFHI